MSYVRKTDQILEASPIRLSSVRVKNAVLGALGGLALALVFIVVGLIKLMLLRRAGASIEGISAEDATLLLFYIGGLH